ncbi:xanthine dehydrogenase family protein molybdopterin-binding subunit [Natronococcus occultus]|uniref:Aerobic-type carbon monoxide dehydrogenase, large subunit CoxL/CutL-like protein n=1 Tax=Natronococcus occultus SP4 TaxID=694430 RepID=L0K2W2_9EURY|nr:molybdopterin cofactor-binding domain-containing protein [Natronococcus occultus]AGB38880.1 aerobic-type carbon monoxide dehydrogenase, large subunit CoxL/CutL-like protein [Natronococcus occultus SP4]
MTRPEPESPPRTAAAETKPPVGESVDKVDGWGLVTGNARYTDDVPTPDTLAVRILRSPHAHARIRAIDTEAAASLDGVRAVLTHEDVPDERFTRTGFPYPAPAPFDERVLNETVRFVGEPVAAVAARTADAAERAVDAIEVDYDVHEHVLDARSAMEPGAPTLHPEAYENPQENADPKRNIVCETSHEEGDVEAGFENADAVVEGEYETQVVQHLPMEVNTTIAWIDDRERLVLRTTTQVSHICRDKIARAFDLNRTDVRVIKPRVGGGFGVRQDTVPGQFIAAALALETGEKVRLRNERKEDLHVSQTRHAQTLRIKTGVREDGTITGMHVDITSNTGAYGCHAFAVLANAAHEPMSVYPCENRLFTGRAVYTNRPPGGAMRGYGAVQGTFGLESHVDEVAAAIGMDPVEFRRRNTIEAGEGSFEPAYSESEKTLSTVGVTDCLERAAETIGWTEGPAEPEDDRYRRGYGVALTMAKSGVPSSEFSRCDMTLEDDGTLTIRVGVGDTGQGSETVMGQIAAGVLGLDTESVYVKADDTDATPWDNGAYASSTTYISGNATEKAARDLAASVRELAGEWFEVAPESVEIADGEVRIPGEDAMTLEQFAATAFEGTRGPKRRLTGHGKHFTALSPKPFAAQLAAVEVDTETGEFEVLRLVNAVDCGRAVNPANVRGQIIGGAVMGLGQTLSEELSFDDSGAPELRGLRDYDVMHAPDLPEIDTELVETYEPTGPFGAKSVGEVTALGPPAAVANAIRDAVDVRVAELPITSSRVWDGLQEGR